MDKTKRIFPVLGFVTIAAAAAFSGAAPAAAVFCSPVLFSGTSGCGVNESCSLAKRTTAQSDSAAVVVISCRLFADVEDCSTEQPPWWVEAGAEQIGPLDSVLVEFVCEDDHVAACTATFLANPCQGQGKPEATGQGECILDVQDDPSDTIPVVGAWGGCHLDP
ncbi:MAG: hypothetical protein ACT4PT_00280 [Methanobacteriota archaeon]